MTNLSGLIERLRAATNGSRELDFHVHIAAVEDAVWPVRDRYGRVTNPDYRMSDYLADYASVINSDDQDFDFPRYTTDLSAIVALVEKLLPGWMFVNLCEWEADVLRARGPWQCILKRLGTQDDLMAPKGRCDHAPTAALAVCLALLLALQSEVSNV